MIFHVFHFPSPNIIIGKEIMRQRRNSKSTGKIIEAGIIFAIKKMNHTQHKQNKTKQVMCHTLKL